MGRTIATRLIAMGKQNTERPGLEAYSEPPGAFTSYYSRPIHNTVSGLMVHSISASTKGLVIPRIRTCSLAPERRLDGDVPDEKSSGSHGEIGPASFAVECYLLCQSASRPVQI
jgi:hypothetical protein